MPEMAIDKLADAAIFTSLTFAIFILRFNAKSYTAAVKY